MKRWLEKRGTMSSIGVNGEGEGRRKTPRETTEADNCNKTPFENFLIKIKAMPKILRLLPIFSKIMNNNPLTLRIIARFE